MTSLMKSNGQTSNRLERGQPPISNKTFRSSDIRSNSGRASIISVKVFFVSLFLGDPNLNTFFNIF